MSIEKYNSDHIEKLIVAAKTDSLTGILNHRTTFDAMDNFLSSDTDSNTHAIFMMDLDNFKKLNDTLGHQQGDDLLIKAANIITNAFAPTDIVGRIGGDEFIALMKDIKSIESVHKKAEHLVNSLQFICSQKEKEIVKVSCSIGVLICKGDTTKIKTEENKHNFSDVFYQADIAMYNVKMSGKGNYKIKHYQTNDDTQRELQDITNFDAISLHTLFENINTSVVIFENHIHLRPVYVSPKYYQQLHIETESKLPTLDIMLAFVHDEDKLSFLEFIEENNGSQEYVYRVIDGKNNCIWRLAKKSFLPMGTRQNFYLVLTITDITEQKEKEIALEKSNEITNEYAKRLRLAFNDKRQRLWEIDLVKQQFAVFFTETSYTIPLDEHFVDTLVADHILHPYYAMKAKDYFQQITLGNPGVSCILKLKFSTESVFSVAEMKYAFSYDTQGVLQKIIGLAEMIPNIDSSLKRFNWEQRFYQAVKQTFSLQFYYNATTDVLLNYSSDDKTLLKKINICSYEQLKAFFPNNLWMIPCESILPPNIPKKNG